MVILHTVGKAMHRKDCFWHPSQALAHENGVEGHSFSELAGMPSVVLLPLSFIWTVYLIPFSKLLLEFQSCRQPDYLVIVDSTSGSRQQQRSRVHYHICFFPGKLAEIV